MLNPQQHSAKPFRQYSAYIVYCMVVCSALVAFSGKHNEANTNSVIVDSQMTRAEALGNNAFPQFILDSQELLTVRYYSFDNKLHEGQLVVHKSLAADVQAIFREIEQSRFPIAKVVPIVYYNWSDSKSIADNNTSAFNYRTIAGTSRLSDHAYGKAIDINPYLNPWVGKKGKSERPYRPEQPGTITADGIVVQAFKKRGWSWGGSWKHSKDYQHFSKKG